MFILLVVSSVFVHFNCDCACCVNACRIGYHAGIEILTIGLGTKHGMNTNTG